MKLLLITFLYIYTAIFSHLLCQQSTLFDIATDLLYDCEITFDGIDVQSQKKKIEVVSDELFSYTHDKMRPYLKEKDFVRCNSKIQSIGKRYFLLLEIIINSYTALESYGSIDQLSRFQITFVDGSKSVLTNVLSSNGNVDNSLGQTIYKPIFEIDKQSLENVENKMIDKVGIVWTSGYEEYDVYNVDLLTNQISCLKNK